MLRFLQELAKDLNLPVGTVQNAVLSAQSSVFYQKANDAVSARLAAGVKAGKITQQESGQINVWWQSRSQTLDQLGVGRAFGGFMGHGFGFHAKH